MKANTTKENVERLVRVLADYGCAGLSELLAAMLAERTRLFDLVRYQRAELHQANLINDEEYVALCADDMSVERLHTYDSLRAELTRLKDCQNRAEYAENFVDALKKQRAELEEKCQCASQHADANLAALTEARAQGDRYKALVDQLREWLRRGATIKATDVTKPILEEIPNGFNSGLYVTFSPKLSEEALKKVLRELLDAVADIECIGDENVNRRVENAEAEAEALLRAYAK